MSPDAKAGKADAAPRKEANAVGSERKRMAGSWRLVGVETGGQQASKQELDQIVALDQLGKWKEQSDAGTTLAEGTSRINPAAKHRTLDWEVKGETNTKRGIYEFVNADSWRVCFAPPDKDRPDRFTTSKKDGRVIWVFQRVKERKGGENE